MYHYLHRLWYMKQNLLPHLAKTLRCAINFIWNLSAFICLSKLNNKNSVSILFCITSDCGTVTCYTCLSKLSVVSPTSNTQDLLLVFSYVSHTTYTGSLDTCLDVYIWFYILQNEYIYIEWQLRMFVEIMFFCTF